MLQKENGKEISDVIIPPEDGSLRRFLPEKKFSIQNTFAALSYPNYRLWFWGQMTSLFGSWMQSTAFAFFIFELTKSPAYLGYVGFASGIPAWFFSFYGGVAADRLPRIKILFATQTAMMLMAFILAIFTFSGIIEPWHLLLFAFLSGITNAFDAPTRHAFVNELVDKEDLVNAIALNSTMFNTATAVGPALGGIVYALFGPAWCFTINGISFTAVLYSLTRMKLKRIEITRNSNSVFSEVADAIKYLRTNKVISGILLITAMLSFFGMGLVTLFPAWAVDILHGDSTTNGFLQSARGFGAVIFALVIATVNKYIDRGRYLVYSVITLPVLIFLFSFNRSFVLSVVLLIFIGGMIITQYNLSNGLIQTNVDEKFRGRILSFYTFTFFALYPLGSLWIGYAAEHFGIASAVLINSVILFLFFLLFKIRSSNISVLR
ncbi:MAG TPA: MFS transporter [Melioribacteraceae bacterium]|nr:MFS transporter [Melioribacteraceae bacterium]